MNRQILWVAVHFNRARSKRVLVKRSAVGQASTNEKTSTENGATGLKFAEKTSQRCLWHSAPCRVFRLARWMPQAQ